MFRIFVLYPLITQSIKIPYTHPGTATNSLKQGMKTFDASHHQQEVKISQDDTIKLFCRPIWVLDIGGSGKIMMHFNSITK